MFFVRPYRLMYCVTLTAVAVIAYGWLAALLVAAATFDYDVERP
jgi:hypothetical protein